MGSGLGITESTVHREITQTPVLSLAGMELAFFRAAHMELCFVFVTTTVLTAHQCFIYY